MRVARLGRLWNDACLARCPFAQVCVGRARQARCALFRDSARVRAHRLRQRRLFVVVQNVTPPPQAVAQAPRPRRGAPAANRRTRLDVGPAVSFGEGMPSVGQPTPSGTNPPNFSSAPTHQKAYDEDDVRTAKVTTADKFRCVTLRRSRDSAERPVGPVVERIESAHSLAPFHSSSLGCRVPPKASAVLRAVSGRDSEGDASVTPFSSCSGHPSDPEAADEARCSHWKRPWTARLEGHRFSQSEDSEDSKESDEERKARALLAAPSLLHEHLRRNGSFFQLEGVDKRGSGSRDGPHAVSLSQLARRESRTRRSRTVDLSVAPDALESSRSAHAPRLGQAHASTCCFVPPGHHGQPQLAGGSGSVLPPWCGAGCEETSVPECYVPSRSLQGPLFHNGCRPSSTYQSAPMHGAEPQASQRDGISVPPSSPPSADGPAGVSDQAAHQGGADGTATDGVLSAAAADPQTAAPGPAAARAPGSPQTGPSSSNFLSPNVVVDDDIHKGRQRSNAVDITGLDKKDGDKEEDAAVTREYIDMFLRPDEVEEFMKQVDLAGESGECEDRCPGHAGSCRSLCASAGASPRVSSAD